tara:strand:+ start:3983 stop:5914 length:1932 start_codon:yes stop_codon:yes gene_type:complete
MERIFVVSFNSESLPVELDGVSYLVDARQYGRTTVPALREQRDTSGEAGENALDTSGAWTRSQTDWTYGAGQTHFDLADSDRRRFNTSVGVDVWTKGEIALLPITETGANTPTFTTGDIITQRVVNAAGTEYLYVANGTSLYLSSNAAAASPTWTTITVGGTTTSITSDGTNVYLGFGGVIVAEQSVIGSGSTSAFGSLDPNLIKIVAGRVIAADDNAIYELDAAGAKATSSLDYSLPLASSAWVDVDAGPGGIYAAANTEETGAVYHIGVSSTDGTLTTPTIAGELPRGERINAILVYGPVLCLATNKGFRTSLIDTNSNGITIGPVIETGGEAYELEADGQFVWWGAGYGNTFRADLTRFTDTLVPAYASDLISAASASATDLVKGVTRLNNGGDPKLFLGVVSGGAAVLQRESRTAIKVASGTLNVGEVSWSTVAPKLLRSVTVRQDRAQYTFSDPEVTYRETGTTYNQTGYWYRGNPSSAFLGTLTFGATNDANVTDTLTLTSGVPADFTFTTQSSVSYEFVLTLTRDGDDTTKGPIVGDWLTFAIATPSRVDEIILPIVLRRQVLTAHNSGAPATFNSGAIFTTLRQRMESGVTLDYTEGTRAEKVTIDRISMSPDRLSDDGTWWEGTLTVRLLTVPA